MFNKNLRERNPQTGIVMAIFDGCTDISVGDKVLLNHFTFCDGNGELKKPIAIHEGEHLYELPYEECFFILDDEGEVLRPIGNFILCEHEKEEEHISVGGILIPNNKHRDKKRLVVLNAGNSKVVSNGDVIMAIHQYGIVINKKQYYRINENQVLAKVL